MSATPPDPPPVSVSPAVCEVVRTAARRAAPEECCGLLTGPPDSTGFRITEAHASPNLAGDRRAGFEIDPKLWLALRDRARGGGERLLGLYHSHPAGPAGPSTRDTGDAWDLGLEAPVVWLVASGGGELGAWIWRDGAFTAAPLRCLAPGEQKGQAAGGAAAGRNEI